MCYAILAFRSLNLQNLMTLLLRQLVHEVAPVCAGSLALPEDLSGPQCCPLLGAHCCKQLTESRGSDNTAKTSLWDNIHAQGVGCTPWGSAGVPGSPPLLRGRRGPQSPHSLTHTNTLTHWLTNSLIHWLTHSLPQSTWTYIHTHKLTHHHRSITLILSLPFLLFYDQTKSKEVGNMWGYPVLYCCGYGCCCCRS